MSESTVQAPGPATSAAGEEAGSFRLYRHIVIGVAIAIIAPFTAFAWPFAILLGIVIGMDDVDRRHNVRRSASVTIVRVLAVTGGILAMFFFGVIIGGLIALPIVALAALSERAAADADPTDRIVARLVILIFPILAYVVLLALGVSINIRFGA